MRAPVSSVVQLVAIVLTASHRAHTCIVQRLRLCVHVCLVDPVRSGFKPPPEVDCLNVHSIQIGAFNPDWFNVHSVWIQPMCVE